MFQEIKAKIRNMIKQGFISLVFDDAGPYPLGQVTVNGKASKYVRLSPYGLLSNPPTGSQVLLFSSQGQESTKFGLANNTLNRKKSLKEGEAALYNEMTGAFVLMKEDGTIEIEAPSDLNITVPNLNLTGNLNVEGDVDIVGDQTNDGTLDVTGNISSEGDISADGDVIADALATAITLLTHFHLGNLGFNTGVPVAGAGVAPPGSPPSVSGNDIVDGNGTKSTQHVHLATWTDPAGSANTGNAT